MKDIAVPHGTPARHLTQINRLNTAWRPKKGNVRKRLCLLTVLGREILLCSCSLLLASTLHLFQCPLPTNPNYSPPYPGKILTSIIDSNDHTKESSSRGNPKLLAWTMWINTYETISKQKESTFQSVKNIEEATFNPLQMEVPSKKTLLKKKRLVMEYFISSLCFS